MCTVAEQTEAVYRTFRIAPSVYFNLVVPGHISLEQLFSGEATNHTLMNAYLSHSVDCINGLYLKQKSCSQFSHNLTHSKEMIMN